MRMLRVIACAAVALGAGAPALPAQSAAQKINKLDPVAVVGCLKEMKPDVWMLVNASDPVPSTANAPSPKELADLPIGGKNEVQLIGVTGFKLSAHKDQSVVAKGLLVKTGSPARLNLTSVTMRAATCPARPEGKLGALTG